MLVGGFGIYKKRKLARSTQTMYKLNGVQVDYYAVDDQDEDGFTATSYFPIYEYGHGIRRMEAYQTEKRILTAFSSNVIVPLSQRRYDRRLTGRHAMNRILLGRLHRDDDL